MKKSQFAILHLLGCTLNKTPIDESLFEGNSIKFWNNLYQQSYDQCVASLVLDSIEKLPVDKQPDLENKLKLVYLRDKTEKLYPKHLETILQLRRMLKVENLKSYVLKGTDISQLYEIPSHRKLGDIDLYTPDYHNASEIFAANGIKIKKGTYVEKHDEFRLNDIEVEHHKQPVHQYPTFTSHRRLRYLKETIGDKSKFYAVYLLMHKLNHLEKTGLKLHLICDWNMYIKAYGVKDLLAFNDKELIRFANGFNHILLKYMGLDKEYLKKEDGSYMLPSKEEELLGEEILTVCFDIVRCNRLKAHRGMPLLKYEIHQYYHFFGLKHTLVQLSWTFINQILYLF